MCPTPENRLTGPNFHPPTVQLSSRKFVFATFPIRALNSNVVRQMARLGLIFSYHLKPWRRDSNPFQSEELHQIGNFEGRSSRLSNSAAARVLASYFYCQ